MIVVDARNAYLQKKTDIQHIFTLYKEHDKSKLKLKYIREELCVCVAKIYDLSVYYLNKFVEVNYIGKKLRIALEQKIVGCSNQFDHQSPKTCYEENGNFSEYFILVGSRF
jgi:hypothetical protein